MTPDGKEVWVTSETDGGVSIVDAHAGTGKEDLKTGGRPRTVTFTRDGRWAFVPSETEGVVRVGGGALLGSDERSAVVLQGTDDEPGAARPGRLSALVCG